MERKNKCCIIAIIMSLVLTFGICGENGNLAKKANAATAGYQGVNAGTLQSLGTTKSNGHIYAVYEMSDSITSWFKAKEACEQLGGYLATITSAEENATALSLLNQVRKQRNEDCWIGATNESGEWKWVTGESWGYTNWAQNQPDSSKGCYLQYESDKWNDESAFESWDIGMHEQMPGDNWGGWGCLKYFMFECEADASSVQNTSEEVSPTNKPISTVEPTSQPTTTPDSSLSNGDNNSDDDGFEEEEYEPEEDDDDDDFSVEDADIVGLRDSYVYTGSEIKPSFTVDLDGEELNYGEDYSIAYKNNKKVGKAEIRITGKGEYDGILYASFDIVPKGTTIKTKTGGKKRITLSWKKQSKQTDGYEIQYSTSSKMKSAKILDEANERSTSRRIKNLKAKTTYYVRIRTYKVVSKKKYVSSWSKIVSVKTK